MVANTLAIYSLSPVLGQADVSANNTALDGTGTLATLVTGGADGTRIDFVVYKAINSTHPGLIRLFIDDGGGNIFLWDEAVVTVSAPTAVIQSSRGIIPCFFVLPSGFILKASKSDTAGDIFKLFAHGGSY